jgi:hypothetical protein
MTSFILSWVSWLHVKRFSSTLTIPPAGPWRIRPPGHPHHTADGGGLFHEFDQKTGIGKIQGSLHARNTTTDDHNRAISRILIHEMSISYSLMLGVIRFWMWFSFELNPPPLAVDPERFYRSGEK